MDDFNDLSEPKKNMEPGQMRATEVTQAMQGVPGYGDDTMLFVARFGDKVKNTLSEEEFKEFVALTMTFNMQKAKKNTKEAAAETREKVMKMLEPYPELIPEYDLYAKAARAVAAAYWGPKASKNSK